MCFGMLIRTTDSHLSFLPVIRKNGFFGRRELGLQFPRNASFFFYFQNLREMGVSFGAD